VQSLHLPPALRTQSPGSQLFEQAGAQPGLPVFFLTNRIGKASRRPRKRERNSLTFSAGLVGGAPLIGSGTGRETSGEADAVASSERSASIFVRASAKVRSNSASRCSSRARSWRMSSFARVLDLRSVLPTTNP
jgi:hypothetical protein